MSVHKSLKLKNTLGGARSVLTRWERIVKLTADDKWEDGDSVLGLPKVRTKFKIRSRKALKKAEAEAKASGEGDKKAKK